MTDNPFGAGGRSQTDFTPAVYTRLPLPFHLENIPAVLKTLPQWLCWKLEHRNGKLTKVPYNAKTGRYGKSNDPATWTGFDKALKESAEYDGIGFAFHNGDGLCGIDLDKCLGEVGELSPEAWAIVERFRYTYIELSPSGSGLHIFCHGVPARCGKNAGMPKWIEVYNHTSPRYLTVTGQRVFGGREVTEQQAALNWLYETYFKPPNPRAFASAPALTLDDAALLEKARRAENGANFSRLWAGGHDGDASSADLALCCLLAFWTSKDAERMDRLFRQSGRMRKKWDEKHSADGRTYGQMTLARAMEACREVYAPRQNGEVSRAWPFQSLPEPQPLLPEAKRPGPYPLDALGEVLGGAAKGIAEHVQVPHALAGQSVLSAASLAVQPYADVELDGRRLPCSLFALTVVESGDRKTSTDREALREIHRYQKELWEQYRAEWEPFDQESREGEARPEFRPLLMDEPTLEGVYKAFRDGRPSQGLFNDEGGQFIGGHAMNKDNLLKTISGLSRLWDGASISRVRSGRGESIMLYGVRFSCHLQLQPVIARGILSSPLLKGQGMLARFLMTQPESLAGTRFYRDTNAAEDPRLQRYWKQMRRILDIPLPVNENGELTPGVLTLSKKAKVLWIDTYNAIEAELRPGGEFAAIREAAAKAAEDILRMAGVMAVFEFPDEKQVEAEVIDHASQLMQHYLREAIRMTVTAPVPEESRQAQELLEWLRKNVRGVFKASLVYQRGPRVARPASKANRLLQVLQEHSWIGPYQRGFLLRE